jgi:activator of 2-hydroxyglutaryl-CoA dehydratase
MMGSETLYLGIDVGSVSANTVIMNDRQEVLEEHYTRIKGQPLQAVSRILEEILKRIHRNSSTASLLQGSEEAYLRTVERQFCQRNHRPGQVRSTVLSTGQNDHRHRRRRFQADFIEEEEGHHKISDFSMNTLCAAGTGSFLDQQASRLGLTIEEFGQLALKSTNPPRIAGRCSVFAKSDMIHLQQIATPDYDIVAGLCYALARNFKSNIGKGKIFAKPISFQGGVAANVGMRKAFLDVLELSDGELIIPKYFASMGAIGAVLVTQENKEVRKGWKGLSHLYQYVQEHQEAQTPLKPLCLASHHLSPHPMHHVGCMTV